MAVKIGRIATVAKPSFAPFEQNGKNGAYDDSGHTSQEYLHNAKRHERTKRWWRRLVEFGLGGSKVVLTIPTPHALGGLMFRTQQSLTSLAQRLRTFFAECAGLAN